MSTKALSGECFVKADPNMTELSYMTEGELLTDYCSAVIINLGNKDMIKFYKGFSDEEDSLKKYESELFACSHIITNDKLVLRKDPKVEKSKNEWKKYCRSKNDVDLVISIYRTPSSKLGKLNLA
jgi:hypothetical protein